MAEEVVEKEKVVEGVEEEGAARARVPNQIGAA